MQRLLFLKVRGDRKEAKISQVRLEDTYIAMKELHETDQLSIVLLCDIAGISRAAYYRWLNRTPSSRELENEEIIKEMKVIHKKVEGIYGYRRMKLTLNRKFGKNFNHKCMYRRLMNIAGIQSVIRRKKKRYKHTKPQHVAEKL